MKSAASAADADRKVIYCNRLSGEKWVFRGSRSS